MWKQGIWDLSNTSRRAGEIADIIHAVLRENWRDFGDAWVRYELPVRYRRNLQGWVWIASHCWHLTLSAQAVEPACDYGIEIDL